MPPPLGTRFIKFLGFHFAQYSEHTEPYGWHTFSQQGQQLWYLSWIQGIETYATIFIFWCWVSVYVSFTYSLIGFCFIMIVMTIIGILMAILFILYCPFSLSVTKYFWFCKCAPPWMFLPLDIPFEYWIGHVPFGHFYVMFRFSTRIFYRGVPGFETGGPCGVWCHGLTTHLLYVGLLFGSLIWNDGGFVSLT